LRFSSACSPNRARSQAGLARLVAINAELNRTPIATICADLRQRKIQGLVPNSFDLVIANLPYRRKFSGHISPDLGRRAARTETSAELDDFVAAAARYARFGARVSMVFDATRAIDLISVLRTHTLEPKRIRFVHPHRDRPASTILIEARKGGGVETAIEPPLIMYDSPGIYGAEARWLLSEE
jgi:tRNA1(Val) A37 N6-methylase TrmN6